MLSPFLIPPPETPYPISPIPASIRVCPQLSTHSYLPTLTLGHQAFTEPGNSSPIDARQGHPLLHISLVPWVTPCVLLRWWFRPWKHWLVDVVLPMGIQTPSAEEAEALLWAFNSIYVRLWQSVSGDSYTRFLPTWTFLASTIVSVFGNCIWDESPGGALSGCHFLLSLSYTLSLYLLQWVLCYPF